MAEESEISSAHSCGGPSTGVAIFVYNRPKHTANLFESILAAENGRTYPFCVFSDGPKLGDYTDTEKVEEVRDVCSKYSGSLTIDLQCADRNQGLAQSIVQGVGRVLRDHEQVIVLEDDLSLNRYFFSFMSLMLERYSDVEKVFQVSAWMVPTKQQLPSLGLYRVPGSWGWGTWRRAWLTYDHDVPRLISGVKAKGIDGFNANGKYNHFNTLLENDLGITNTWAVRWYASMYINGGLALYPSKALVSNLGFDGSGTNCGTSSFYYSDAAAVEYPAWQDESLVLRCESSSYALAFESFYGQLVKHWTHVPLWRRVVNRLRRILHRNLN